LKTRLATALLVLSIPCLASSEAAVAGVDSFPIPEGDGAHRRARVAAYANEGFLATWTHYPIDGSPSDVAARWFDENCQPLTGDLVLNQHREHWAHAPDVVPVGSGLYVGVWLDSGRGLVARLLENLAPTGNEVLLVDASMDDVIEFGLASDIDGGFALVWNLPEGPQAGEVFVQRFDAAAAPRGGAVSVGLVPSVGTRPAVSVAQGSGKLLVAWEDSRFLRGRLFNEINVPIGDSFDIAVPDGFSRHNSPAIRSYGDRFRVVWQEDVNLRDDAIRTRWVGTDGSMGDLTTVAAQGIPLALDLDSSGNYIVAYGDYYYETMRVFARRFTEASALLDSITVAERVTGYFQYVTSVVLRADDLRRFVVAWDLSFPGTHTILGRCYQPLFGDGFESGDLSQWSSAVP
jgi:hypothetical protein